jgi:hypothetical protein
MSPVVFGEEVVVIHPPGANAVHFEQCLDDECTPHRDEDYTYNRQHADGEQPGRQIKPDLVIAPFVRQPLVMVLGQNQAQVVVANNGAGFRRVFIGVHGQNTTQEQTGAQ